MECFLAGVKSTMLQDPDTWDPPSIQKFEELTQGKPNHFLFHFILIIYLNILYSNSCQLEETDFSRNNL